VGVILVNCHWMVLFQNSVRQSRSPTKMAAHSAVALLLKAILIQVSDYRLLGASGCIGSYVKLSSAVQPTWSEGGTTKHNFGRGPPNDYFIKVWLQLSNWFQTRRLLCEFPIGSYVKLKFGAL
jgi:hypothetical protein